MTRINVVPVTELCDQHLLAEHRELTRIPNFILKHNGNVKLAPIDSDYVLGTGHVRFFYDKLVYLYDRYCELHGECQARGFLVKNNWPYRIPLQTTQLLWRNYSPTYNALKINRERIALRMPKKPRFTPRKD